MQVVARTMCCILCGIRKHGEQCGAPGVAVLGPSRGMLLDGRCRNDGSGASRRQVRYLTVAPSSGSGVSMRLGAPVQVQLASD
jgi:hypothetical protein